MKVSESVGVNINTDFVLKKWNGDDKTKHPVETIIGGDNKPTTITFFDPYGRVTGQFIDPMGLQTAP